MPDLAVLKGVRCPECGADLTNRNPWAHALDHWPEQIPFPQQNKKAVQRQAKLRHLAEKAGFVSPEGGA